MKLPRYVMKVNRGSRVVYRYNPPADAIDHGVLKRKDIGEDYSEAVAYADAQNKILDEWRSERKYLKNLSEKSKVSDLIKSYTNNITFTKLSAKAQHDYKYYLSRWLNNKAGGVPLASCRLADLNTPSCQKIYEEHAEHSVSLSNHCLAVYRLLFNYAIRHGYTIFNPFSKVLRRADKPRKTVWTREDVRAFLNTAYSEFKWRNIGLIAQMAYEYGQRMGDMRMLTWDSFDLDNGVLHLEQSKRRARVSIPTSAGLLTMLRQQKQEYGWQKYVAPSNIPDRQGGLRPYTLFSLSKVANKVMEEAHLPKDLRLQDLRRTAVTEMIEVGVPLPNIMAISGHATPQSLTPYIKNTLRSATVASQMRGLI